MSVSAPATYSIPDPAAYTYSYDLPAGLASAPASSSTSTSSSSSSTPPTAPAASPYETAFASLQQYDAEELLNVSFGSANNALTNVSSVLAQAAAFQEQQEAAQQQAAQTLANTPPNIPDPQVPTIEDVIGQSDTQANAVIANYAQGPAGSSILDFLA